MASQVVRVVKNPPANAGDTRDLSLIPGLGRSLGEGNCKQSDTAEQTHIPVHSVLNNVFTVLGLFRFFSFLVAQHLDLINLTMKYSGVSE